MIEQREYALCERDYHVMDNCATVLFLRRKGEQMRKRRLIYLNWIAELGGDPTCSFTKSSVLSSFDNNKTDISDTVQIDNLRERVSEAVKSLDEPEQDFIHQYYYLGLGHRQISELTGRRIHKIEAYHKRTLNRLRIYLSEFVEREYGVHDEKYPDCQICSSDECDQINRIIARRDKTETWRPVMREISRISGVYIRSPQILIGHEKYHMKKLEKDV